MPIIKPSRTSAPVFYPKTDYPIVKYIDLLRFISLLQRRALFFCRVDKLEDKFEGTTPKANYALRKKWYKQTDLANPRMTDAEIDAKILEYDSFQKKLKSITCICCWNNKESESAALWKIYSDFNKGIMIKSSISKLIKALEKSEQQIKLTEVKYIDYNKEAMPDGNTNFPFLHKQKAYSYEEEVRLIHEIPHEFGWEHDWENEEVEEGIYIDANVTDLIDEIVIAPYSPNWFLKMLQSLLEKYELSKPISKSEFSFV